MAKPITLVGRTQILAAIYNPETLPTAIFAVGDYAPFCAHCLRESDLSFFEKTFLPHLRQINNVAPEDSKKDEELKIKLYKFFEDYPERGHTCTGCASSEQIPVPHLIKYSESACTKTTEDCA